MDHISLSNITVISIFKQVHNIYGEVLSKGFGNDSLSMRALIPT